MGPTSSAPFAWQREGKTSASQPPDLDFFYGNRNNRHTYGLATTTNCTRTPRNTEASPSTLPVNEDEVMRACGLDMLTPLGHEVRMISSPVIICQPASTHAMSALPTSYISPEDYLELERRAPTKSQYFKGEIFAMAGASERHISIVANITSSFVSQLKGRPCKVYPTDMRVRVAATGLYTYPDIVVLCGAPRFDDKNRDTLLNPVVIFEILSKSTESYDRGAKFPVCQ